VGGAVGSIDEWGDDPVALAHNHSNLEGSNVIAGGSGSGSGSDEEKASHHSDARTDHSNSQHYVEDSESSGSVEFLGSVKEGKKPVRIV